jgi:SAM-dependent methyltransferase
MIHQLIRSDQVLLKAVAVIVADRRGLEAVGKRVIDDDRTFQAFANVLLSKRAGYLTDRIRAMVDMTDVGMHNQSARDRWIERTLSRIPAGSRVLDAGAGERQYQKYCGHLRYVSQDLGEYTGIGDLVGLQTGKWDVRGLDIVGDIGAIPEQDGSFDAIMCTEVLEHLPDPLRALKEFSRLVRKGGVVVLTAPFCSLTHFAPFHYSTGFSRYYYRTHLEALGFVIEELQPNGNYFDYLAQEVRRIPYVAERYVKATRDGVDELATMVMLRVLDEYSKKGTTSSELLTFGWFVQARKA